MLGPPKIVCLSDATESATVLTDTPTERKTGPMWEIINSTQSNLNYIAASLLYGPLILQEVWQIIQALRLTEQGDKNPPLETLSLE